MGLARGRWGWALAAAFLVAVVGLCFHEALAGHAAIDALVDLPAKDPLYGGPRPLPLPLFDPSALLLFQAWDTFMLATFRAGELPMWLPNMGCGAPLMANGQAAPFEPIKWLCCYGTGALGPAASWNVAGRFLLAACGALVLARRLGCTPPAAALVGISFALSGFFTYWVQLALGVPLALLPWLLWAGERLIARQLPRDVALFGLMIGCTGLWGHPETALYAAGAAVTSAALGLAGTPGGWLALGRAVALGVAIAGVAVVPFLAYLRETQSYLFDREHSYFAGMGSRWPLPTALRLLKAHLTSPEAQQVTGYFNSFVGAAALTCLPAGLGAGPVRRVAGCLLGWTAAALVLFPPTSPLHWLPVAPNSFYAVGLAALALALLGGVGLDRLARDGSAGPRRLAAATAVGLAGLALFDLARLEGGRALLYQSFTATALAVGLLVLLTRRRPAAWLAPAVLALGTAELIASTRLALPPLAPFTPFATPAVRFLHANAAGMRIAGDAPRADTHVFYGLEGFELVDAFLNRRYVAFHRALHAGPHPLSSQLGLEPDFRPGLLDLANVAYVLAPPGPLADKLAAAGYPVAFRDGALAVFHNPTALPRAWVAYGADWVAEDPQAAAERLAATPARFHRRVLAETMGGRALDGWQDRDEPITPAVVERRSANTVVVRAHASQPGMLVLAETYAAGWRATVDGRTTAIVPADVLFRGVPIPAGEHVVAFTYAPLPVYAGLALSLWGLLLALVGLMWAQGVSSLRKWSRISVTSSGK
ncbi:MAG: hypothetical protein JWM80_1224 [Cyanobacteria bacterium RYN_339]|nr:hypothetical protein [Cyanobacteria bacterium RYN_339]